MLTCTRKIDKTAHWLDIWFGLYVMKPLNLAFKYKSMVHGWTFGE